MKKILLLVVTISLIGCKTNTKDNGQSINSTIHSERELEQLIFQKGDSSAYYELSMQYLDYGYERFLPFAMIMANKYDYPQAYFDTYNCFQNIFDDIAKLDSTTQRIAIKYLQKASIKGHSQAREILGEYYLQGKFVEKDTILGRQLIEQAKDLPY